MSVILVLTTVSSLEDAKIMAHKLIAKEICACVNITSKMHSIYRWNDKIEYTEEYTLLIKTAKDKYLDLEREIKLLHNYKLPEIIAIDISLGSPEYLDWVTS